MRVACLAIAMLMLARSETHGRIIDWQAELDRCRALRENLAPLLLAGEDTSGVARSGRDARRCAWIERRARKNSTGGNPR